MDKEGWQGEPYHYSSASGCNPARTADCWNAPATCHSRARGSTEKTFLPYRGPTVFQSNPLYTLTSTLESMSTCSLLCYRSYGFSGFTYNQKTRECRLVSGWLEFRLPVRVQVLTTQPEDKLILNGKFYRTGRLFGN